MTFIRVNYPLPSFTMTWQESRWVRFKLYWDGLFPKKHQGTLKVIMRPGSWKISVIVKGNPKNLMYFPSFEWVGHEEQLRICPELAVLQNSVWVRGETEAEVINRNTNTATLTELQSSVINTEDCACETTITNTVQKSAWYNQNNFAGRKNNNTHTHISAGVLPKDV